MFGRVSTLAIMAGLAFGAPALAAPSAAKIEAAAKAVQPKVVAWRRDFHEHPELGNQEVRTAAIIATTRGRQRHCLPIGVRQGGGAGRNQAKRAIE